MPDVNSLSGFIQSYPDQPQATHKDRLILGRKISGSPSESQQKTSVKIVKEGGLFNWLKTVNLKLTDESTKEISTHKVNIGSLAKNLNLFTIQILWASWRGNLERLVASASATEQGKYLEKEIVSLAQRGDFERASQILKAVHDDIQNTDLLSQLIEKLDSNNHLDPLLMRLRMDFNSINNKVSRNEKLTFAEQFYINASIALTMKQNREQGKGF